MISCLCAHPDSRISDCDRAFTVICIDKDGDRTLFRGILDGIAKQVFYHLVNTLCVEQQPFRDRRLDLQAYVAA